jgi:hypothetical protein
MKPNLSNNLHLFVASMGKIFRITDICHTMEEANAIMARHSDRAMIAEDAKAGLIFLAEKYGPKCPSSVIKQLYS